MLNDAKFRQLKIRCVEHARRLIKPRSFSRFAVIGVINTCMGVGLYPLLDVILAGRLGPNRLLAVTYTICTASAFLLHRFFTFESRGSYRSEIVKYVILSSATFFLNALLLNLSLHYLTLSADVVQTFISTVLSAALMVANYFGLNHLVFRKTKTSPLSSRPD